MRAKIVSVSKPIMAGLENAADLIAYCARVSNPSNQFNAATADKLVAYLIENKHWSPLEMVNVVVEIECPRDIARQILRHRSFSFQEFSQRYSDVTQLEQPFCERELRMQDPKNRQNSLQSADEDCKAWWQEQQLAVLDVCKRVYREALAKGVAKEVARVVLPEGLTMSRMYVNGSLRSWIHYLDVRTEEGITQLEHVQIARMVAEAIAEAFPTIVKATQ